MVRSAAWTTNNISLRKWQNWMGFRCSISSPFPTNSLNSLHKHIQINRWHTSNRLSFITFLEKTNKWRTSSPSQSSQQHRCHIRKLQSFSLSLTPRNTLHVSDSDIIVLPSKLSWQKSAKPLAGFQCTAQDPSIANCLTPTPKSAQVKRYWVDRWRQRGYLSDLTRGLPQN